MLFIILRINGVIYDYTVGVGEALAVFRNRIVAALDPLYANITIAAGAGDGDITLTGINPGEFFPYIRSKGFWSWNDCYDKFSGYRNLYYFRGTN
jgi:hypothetical protein